MPALGISAGSRWAVRSASSLAKRTARESSGCRSALKLAATALSLVTVGTGATGPTVPRGFVGVSTEYATLGHYEGVGVRGAPVDRLLPRLIGALSPGGGAVLRVGGDSTDHTWWPLGAGGSNSRPRWATYSLSPAWTAATRALATAAGARLLLGINLEAGSVRLARVEAARLVAGLGRARVAGLEIGNEPELYDALSWYRSRGGRRVRGRGAGYGPAQFSGQFAQFAAALPAGMPVAGPSSGSVAWGLDLDSFAAAQPRLRLLTVHAYPLKACGVRRGAPGYPTLAQLLAPDASSGMAQALAPDVAAAHAGGLPIRIDELNSVSCGGARGVSDAFGAALWAVDAMFALAWDGFDGVNIHTRDNAVSDRLFAIRLRHGHWIAQVTPEYRGLRMFAQAAPAGSQLLSISGTAGAAVRAWATRGADGVVRVTLVNAGAGATPVPVSLPGASAAGSVALLTSSGGGVSAVPPRGAVYTVTVPGPGAALLTLRLS